MANAGHEEADLLGGILLRHDDERVLLFEAAGMLATDNIMQWNDRAEEDDGQWMLSQRHGRNL